MNGILHRENTTKERILKNISFCEIYYSKYQLIKSMYKITTSVSTEITWSLMQLRDTAKLKVLKKSAL